MTPCMVYGFWPCETCGGSGLVVIGWEDGVAEQAECASCEGEGRYWAGRFPSHPKAALPADMDDPYKMDDPFADADVPETQEANQAAS